MVRLYLCLFFKRQQFLVILQVFFAWISGYTFKISTKYKELPRSNQHKGLGSEITETFKIKWNSALSESRFPSISASL